MKNIKFWYRLLDVIWISIVALFANHIFELKVNFYNSVNWGEIIKIVLLTISIMFFNVFFFNYKKIIKDANELYQKQIIDFDSKKGFGWKSIDSISNEKWTNSSKRIPCILISFTSLLLYTYDWNSLF